MHSNLDDRKEPYTKTRSKASTKMGPKSGLLSQSCPGSAQGQMDQASLQHHSLIFLGDRKLDRMGRLWIRKTKENKKQANKQKTDKEQHSIDAKVLGSP